MSAATRLSGRLRGAAEARLAAGAIAFAAVTVVTALIAYPSIYTAFAEDEGYMLISLQSFLDRGSLYDDVYAQYGPFYFELWGGVYSLLGLSFDQDTARLVTMTVWVLCGLALGLTTLRITGSVILGLGVQAITFTALGTLVNEPMHPGGLICLLLVAIVAIASFVGPRPSVWPMALLGGAVAALVLTKINVGAFALVALALACVCSYRVLSSRRWLRLLVEAAFVGLPVLLMLSELGESWVRHYAAHVSLAALAVVIVLRARSLESRDPEELWWIGGGLLAVAATSCLAVIGAGTSFTGLFEGLIVQPLNQGEAFELPLELTGRTWLFDAVGLAGAIAYWYAVRRRPGPAGRSWLGLVSLLSILVGVQLALSVIGKTLLGDPAEGLAGDPFALLAYVWVALVPVAPGAPARFAFVRLLLPPLALLQALHAFPVAGSQVLWGAFLLVPVGAICVGEGVRGMARFLDDAVERRALAAFGAVTVAAIGFYIVNSTLREPLLTARANYDAMTPLDLPGSEMVRLAPENVDLYRGVTAALNRNCATFVSEPGMYAFNIWTGKEPPTGFNATAWMALFSDSQQQRVIDDTSSSEGLCLLRNAGLAYGWSQGPVPQGRLTRYLDRAFEPVTRVGPYEVLRRDRPRSTG